MVMQFGNKIIIPLIEPRIYAAAPVFQGTCSLTHAPRSSFRVREVPLHICFYMSLKLILQLFGRVLNRLCDFLVMQNWDRVLELFL